MITKKILLLLLITFASYLFFSSDKEKNVLNEEKLYSIFKNEQLYPLLQNDKLKYSIQEGGILLKFESQRDYAIDYSVKNMELELTIIPVKVLSSNSEKISNQKNIKDFFIKSNFDKLKIKLNKESDLYSNSLYKSSLHNNNLLSVDRYTNNRFKIFTFKELFESCENVKKPIIIFEKGDIYYNHSSLSESQDCSSESFFITSNKKIDFYDDRDLLKLNKDLLKGEKSIINKTIKKSNLPVKFEFKSEENKSHHFSLIDNKSYKNYSLDYRIKDGTFYLLVNEVPYDWLKINHIFIDYDFLTEFNNFKIIKENFNRASTNDFLTSYKSETFKSDIFKNKENYFSMIHNLSCDKNKKIGYISVNNKNKKIIGLSENKDKKCDEHKEFKVAVNTTDYIIEEYELSEKWKSFLNLDKKDLSDLNVINVKEKNGLLKIFINDTSNSIEFFDKKPKYTLDNYEDIEIIYTSQYLKDLDLFLNENLKTLESIKFQKPRIKNLKIDDINFVLFIDYAYPNNECSNFFDFNSSFNGIAYNVKYKENEDCLKNKELNLISNIKIFSYIGDYDFNFNYVGDKNILNQRYANKKNQILNRENLIYNKKNGFNFEYYKISDNNYKLVVNKNAYKREDLKNEFKLIKKDNEIYIKLTTDKKSYNNILSVENVIKNFKISE